ncbi:unnamed protein product [Caenorhabditis bovis]|uniref:Epidermal growth factor receptor substrate 15-like 1 n=1 Tax=Caenorhabditis bovis TaxID=2654633 RepID=A0A8S1FFD7_9PELO|nr:unnamed protein product [Caenorhabditis bovis]
MDDSYAIATPHNDVFANIYKEFNPQNLPRVNAAEAAAFLKTSNLPMPTLGQIWELSDSSKMGSLDKRGAYAAFKLVAAAQQGKPVANSCLYDSSLAPPKFGPQHPPIPPASLQHHFVPSFPAQGHAPPVPPPPQFSSQQSSPSHLATAPWGISAVDQAKYDSIFQSLNPVNGKLSGASIRPVLMNSGLDAVSLAKIWELADQDKDGQLDLVEMSVALHLVYKALQNEPVPLQLPPNLIHPTKAMYVQKISPAFPPSRPQFGSRAGSVTSLDEVHMNSSYTMPRQAPRAFSAQPQTNGAVGGRLSGASTPVTGSQMPVSGSMHSINSMPASGEWPVNTGLYAAKFIQSDANSDGFVDGTDVRQEFLATGVAPAVLGRIWALVDIGKTGMLNLEQYSLMMYMIDNFKQGGEIPYDLPAHLVPPSLRDPSTAPPPAQSVATPQLPEATSMELKEALDGENEEMKQLAEAIQEMILERKAAEENVVQLEADMTVKNSKIKNLQIELATLESTVKQLERQKMEANRRLADYDTQISQLEAACAAQREKKEETEKRAKQIADDAQNAEANKASDEKEIEELKKELAELDSTLRTVQSETARESAERETIVSQLTTLERREIRDNSQLEKLSSENEKIKKMTDEIVSAVEEGGEKMENVLKANPALLATSLDNSLLSDDTFYGEASTSNSSHQIQQPPDPFASAKANPAADPFAQVDPFASQGSFAAAFPTDPFSQGFPADASFAPPASSAPPKPAPPRPAPPKSARTTPVPQPAAQDPFAPSQGAAAAAQANFANFADFGSAFN